MNYFGWLFQILVLLWTTGVNADRLFYGNIKFPNSITLQDKRNLGLDATYRWIKETDVSIGTGEVLVFGSAFIQRDSQQTTFNGKNSIGLGAELKWEIREFAHLSVGLRYDFEYRHLSAEKFDGLLLMGDYSFYRRDDFAGGGASIKSGWSNFRFPSGLDQSNRNNAIWQGRFDWSYEFSKVWFGARFERYGAVQFSLDTQGYNSNNFVQAHMGARSKWKIRNRVDLTFGVGFAADQRLVSGFLSFSPTANIGWFTRF